MLPFSMACAGKSVLGSIMHKVNTHRKIHLKLFLTWEEWINAD
ncbi:unnamed protein product, partial [marine sediment metagenome]